QQTESRFATAQAAAERQLQEGRQRLTVQFENDHGAAAQEYSGAKHKANYLYTLGKEKTEADFKESRWTITTLYDSDKTYSKEQLANTPAKISAAVGKIASCQETSVGLLIGWKMADLMQIAPGLGPDGSSPEQQRLDQDDPFKALQQCETTAVD